MNNIKWICIKKKKMRKEKSVNEVEENSKMNINCDVGINGNYIKSTEISSSL